MWSSHQQGSPTYVPHTSLGYACGTTGTHHLKWKHEKTTTHNHGHIAISLDAVMHYFWLLCSMCSMYSKGRRHMEQWWPTDHMHLRAMHVEDQDSPPEVAEWETNNSYACNHKHNTCPVMLHAFPALNNTREYMTAICEITITAHFIGVTGLTYWGGRKEKTATHNKHAHANTSQYC